MQDKISKPERYPNYEVQLQMLSQKRYQDHQCQRQPTADSDSRVSAKGVTKPMAVTYWDTRWILGPGFSCFVEYWATRTGIVKSCHILLTGMISWYISCIQTGFQTLNLVPALFTLDSWIPLSDIHEVPYDLEHFVHVHGVLKTIVHLLSWFAGVIIIVPWYESTVFWLQ